MKLLVTGGCGFIGSHFVRAALEADEDLSIVNLDLLTYAGRKENLADVEKEFGPAAKGAARSRYKFVHGDILDAPLVSRLCKETDHIVHFAAESHVDRSILEAGSFAQTDVLGTQRLLQAALDAGHQRFFFISTDEVYGSRKAGFFRETDKLDPSSPYSASKAGAELMVNAYERTHGLKAVISRTTNNYGTHQHPEKLIPRSITNLLRGQKIKIYGAGAQERDWVHVSDNVRALLMLLNKGKTGTFNIGTGVTTQNLEIAKGVCKALGKEFSSSVEYVADRKGHDWRYAVDWSKMKELGWKPQVELSSGLKQTVDWYMKNKAWWQGHTVD